MLFFIKKKKYTLNFYILLIVFIIVIIFRLLKPVPNLPPPPREHTIATVADLLFVSMQKRFQSIQGPDIEDLDDDEDSGGEFI